MNCVEIRQEGAVATLTLADEENRNALGHQMMAELAAAITGVEADPAIRVVVLTNKGKTFCAGADLRQQGGAAGTGPSISFGDLLMMIRRSPKPYVGRIAGHCVAGGVGLAAALDISVAVDDAGFGFTEVRLGVSPAIISVFCLPKMRTADAREAFLRGNRFNAVAAHRMGLINHAVPRAQLDETVDQVVRDLVAGGPLAIAATKRVLEQVPRMDAAEAVEWATRLSGGLFKSEEAREGMTAYREKRDAAWNTNDQEK
jgi:methylglutaconyl-CoA hydratase